jgi:hypothetical protein
MPAYDDFKDISYQAAIFTPNPEIKKAVIIKDLLSQFGDLFDGDPEILPFPEEVPAQVPRIILKNSKALWELNISKSRIDLVADARHIGVTIFCDKAMQIFKTYRIAARASVGRIALIIRRFYETGNAGIELANHFCKENWISTALNRPEDFKLHAYKKYKIDNRIPEINSWIRHNVGQVSSEDLGSKKGIIVEQDLNTPAEKVESTDYNQEDIKYFFSTVPSEMDEIMRLYYPKVADNAR